MRTKEIKQIGFIISGTATLSLWGGGTGTIDMKEMYLPYDKCTPKNILRCVNDNNFGCEAIIAADIEIGIKYDNGSIVYERSFYDINNPIHTKYFLGWRELREQGIIN